MGKLSKKFEERRKYAFEHPIESGSLLGDIWIILILSIAFGVVFVETINSLKNSNLSDTIIGLCLSIVIICVIIADLYYSIYKPVRRLENELYKKEARNPPVSERKKVV